MSGPARVPTSERRKLNPMNIEGKTVWQHAAGDSHHNHASLCLKWGVIVTGPGTKSWCCYTDQEKREERAEVRRLCEQMRPGDIVVLKIGLSRLLGIGVVGTYEHVDEFNDVDGWDLGHARRIRWLHHDCHEFDTNVFTRSTTTRLYNESALTWIRKTLSETDGDGNWKDVEPLNFSANDGSSSKLEEDDLATHLFEKGLPSDAIRKLLDPKGSFVQMAKWYWTREPSEHETVCHLVVPLLKVLGWTPQKIAIEHSRIDVALFSRLPRDNDNLALVVEAKRLHQACLGAFEQARHYADKYANCKRIIVTDGLRYGVAIRDGDNWPKSPKPHAYLNVRRLRSRYPIYGNGGSDIGMRGAQEAIHVMTPEWNLEHGDL